MLIGTGTPSRLTAECTDLGGLALTARTRTHTLVADVTQAAELAASELPMEGVNWIGVAAFNRREVQRLLAVAAQSVGGPMLSTLLFLALLGVALGGHAPAPGVAPDLAAMLKRG
jgi:hypothetical protein